MKNYVLPALLLVGGSIVGYKIYKMAKPQPTPSSLEPAYMPPAQGGFELGLGKFNLRLDPSKIFDLIWGTKDGGTKGDITGSGLAADKKASGAVETMTRSEVEKYLLENGAQRHALNPHQFFTDLGLVEVMSNGDIKTIVPA